MVLQGAVLVSAGDVRHSVVSRASGGATVETRSSGSDYGCAQIGKPAALGDRLSYVSHEASRLYNKHMKRPMPASEEEWQKVLTPEEYRVLRKGRTEAPFSGKYFDADKKGVYQCKACSAKLFSTDQQLDSRESGSGLQGWPSFSDPVVAEHIGTRPDSSYGMHRTEVYCKNCGSHLGHIFYETVKGQNRKHYCINSVCLDLKEE